MSTNTSHPHAPAARPAAVVPDSRPFAWLQPAAAMSLSIEAEEGLDDLRLAAEDAVSSLTRALVDFTFRYGRTLDLVNRRPGPTTSVLNRRRRSARLWINSILDGGCDAKTLRDVTCVWLPQLAGTGPEPRRAVGQGRAFAEYLRGAFTAVVFAEAEANLVPRARALNALEGVLGVHLRAIDAAADS